MGGIKRRVSHLGDVTENLSGLIFNRGVLFQLEGSNLWSISNL